MTTLNHRRPLWSVSTALLIAFKAAGTAGALAAPSIEAYSPAGGGWPGTTLPNGTFVPGTLVVITGRNFHSTPEMDRNIVTFAGTAGARITAPVVWASPNEIHYEPDGIVADASNVPGGLDGPRGVAVDDSGNVFIADRGHHRIVRVSATGTVTTWGTPGSGPGQFNAPTGVAVDDSGFVYVADTMNHRIQKFNNTGTFVTQWGAFGQDLGMYDMPVDVDVLTFDGGPTFVYVADSNNHRVQRTNGDGSLPMRFFPPPDAGRILGVAVGRPYGYCYATDPMRRRLYAWAWMMGSPARVIGQPYWTGDTPVDFGFAFGIAQDPDGFIYVADNGQRVVRKFDSSDPAFGEIARFGLTPTTVPTVTPDDEFVDPVDVAVSDLKATYTVDRSRNRVIRYIPRDSQELWVHVPEGAVTGMMRVQTDDGHCETNFHVFQLGSMAFRDAHLTQGLEEYPPVAGKRTAMIVRMSTPTSGFPSPELESFWGHPAYDHTELTIRRNGSLVGTITAFDTLGIALNGLAGEAEIQLLIEIPPTMVSDPGDYDFDLRMERSGSSPLLFNRHVDRQVSARRSLNIGAYVLSHLSRQGNPIPARELSEPMLIELSPTTQTLTWLDMNALLSGFANFNRLYPSRHSFTDVHYIAPIIDGAVVDGVDDDEVRDILRIMEWQRLALNEGMSIPYDYMIAVLARQFAPGWNGIMSPDGGWRSALVSIGRETDGTSILDVGVVTAHEIAHHYDVVRPGMPGRLANANSNQPLVASAFPAWHSLTRFLINTPRSPMAGGAATGGPIRDIDAFFPALYGSMDGDYVHLFDALPNPHPKDLRWLEVPCDSSPAAPRRPKGSHQNLTLLGTIDPPDDVTVNYCYVGRPGTPVTSRVESKYSLAMLGPNGGELLTWPIPVGFELSNSATDPGEKQQSKQGMFRVTAPYMQRTQLVEIRHREDVIHTLAVPAGEPTVEIILPKGGEQLDPEDQLEIRWQGSHPRNAPLTYRVEYTPDGGQTYRLIAHSLAEDTLTCSHGMLPGSDEGQIRVTASDGFHLAEDISPAFSVARKSPSVHILWPRDGEIIPQGRPIRAAVIAEDPEDGSLGGPAITWQLDQNPGAGLGQEIRLNQLSLSTPRGTLQREVPVGSHLLTTNVTDTDGNTASDSIVFVVARDSDGDGYTDDEERESGTDPDDPLDNPGNEHRVPFGQWQITAKGRWTRFEISNLTPRRAELEIALIRENGQPLRAHPVQIREGAVSSSTSTSAAGTFPLQLDGHASATFALQPTESMEPDFLFGYGTLRLVSSQGAREATFLAHGWIRQPLPGDAPQPAYEGTVVINGGRPFTLTAPLPPARRTTDTAFLTPVDFLRLRAITWDSRQVGDIRAGSR